MQNSNTDAVEKWLCEPAKLDGVDFAKILFVAEDVLRLARQCLAWAGTAPHNHGGAYLHELLSSEWWWFTGMLFLDYELVGGEALRRYPPADNAKQDPRYKVALCLHSLFEDFGRVRWLRDSKSRLTLHEGGPNPFVFAEPDVLPPSLFLARLEVTVELLREIPSHHMGGQNESTASERRDSKPRMTVEEANEKALEKTSSPAKKRVFYERSVRDQARQIGCSFATWRKTAEYNRAVKEGWIKERAVRDATQRNSAPKSVALNESHGAVQSDADEVLSDLIEAEEERPNWETISDEERRQYLADQASDMEGERRGRYR